MSRTAPQQEALSEPPGAAAELNFEAVCVQISNDICAWDGMAQSAPWSIAQMPGDQLQKVNCATECEDMLVKELRPSSSASSMARGHVLERAGLQPAGWTLRSVIQVC